MRNYEQELFDTIWALQATEEAPVHKSEYSIYRSDFQLKEIDKTQEVTYRVFLKSGIQFEITRQKEDQETKYIFYPLWEGPFNCRTAKSLLAVFLMMGIDVQVTGGEANK